MKKLLPIGVPIDVTYVQKCISGIKCCYDNQCIVIPYDQWSWKRDFTDLDNVKEGDSLMVKLTEYVYPENFYLASLRCPQEFGQ